MAVGRCLSWSRLGMLACLLGVSQPVHAADIQTRSVNNVNVITINGPIVPGDEQKFRRVAKSLPAGHTGVALNSPGGNIVDGMNIGIAIHEAHFDTVVLDDDECASVCGIIWLAGNQRFVGERGNVGFHAAYTGHGDDARESGVGNALIGAYLTRLGLSYDAIAYITSPGPDQIQWLTPDDARRLHIDLTILRSEQAEQKRYPFARQQQTPAIEPAPRPEPVTPAVMSPEQQALQMIQGYFDLWSATTTNIDGLAAYYPPILEYYGSVTTSGRVLEIKRAFAARWPDRHYTIRRASVNVKCSDSCTVSGILDWDAKSVERNDHSTGSANFLFSISLDHSRLGGLILAENGSTVSGYKEPLASSPPSTPGSLGSQSQPPSPAFADGRQARIDYETWYASLEDGAYKDGATFWAGNRSAKVPPSCHAYHASNDPVAWRAGCQAAQDRLTPSDLRRTTEQDFKLGWNSLRSGPSYP